MAVAQLEEGWPLGLQPLNVRPAHVVRNGDFSGSVSFNTLISGSPTSASSSSDLDTESTGSFFHDRSITLGSLIGVRSIMDLSKRSLRERRTQDKPINKKKYKPKTWFFFSLCSRETTDADINTSTMLNNCASLGHFLEEERRVRRRNNNQSPTLYGPDGFSLTTPRAAGESNSLFVNGHIAPPRQTSPCLRNSAANGSNRCGDSVMFSCICGRPETSHRV